MKRLFLFLLLLLPCAACARVAASERGSLAHPTMTTSDLAPPSEQHVRAVQEGEAGGGRSAVVGRLVAGAVATSSAAARLRHRRTRARDDAEAGTGATVGRTS